METIICSETSVTNYEPMPRNIPEERRPKLHRGGIPRNGEEIKIRREVADDIMNPTVNL
jgi:hypothetical protein